jgi:hypothetical protein
MADVRFERVRPEMVSRVGPQDCRTMLLVPVRRNKVLWRKQNERSLYEVVRYSGFRVQPGSQDRARTSPIRQRTANGGLSNGVLS